MREILFRGKRIDNGEWVKGDLVINQGDSYIYPWEQQSCYTESKQYEPYPRLRIKVIAVDPFTVGQYTGLTDKNGTKIFEGDIAECVSWNMFFSDKCGKPMEPFRRKMVVVFRNGAFRMKENLPEPLTPNYWDLIYDGDIAIIGNIHDNPELLKGATND